MYRYIGIRVFLSVTEKVENDPNDIPPSGIYFVLYHLMVHRYITCIDLPGGQDCPVLDETYNVKTRMFVRIDD